MVQQPDRLLCGVRRDRVWAEESSTRSVAEVLSVVEPDRAALLTLGADGTYVAMSVRVPKDSRPRHASGFLPTPEGLPVQAALGQRVRVWRVSDGTWLDPFAAWTTSWGARWSPDGQLLAAFVHRGHQAPSVAVWNSSTTRRRTMATARQLRRAWGLPSSTMARPGHCDLAPRGIRFRHRVAGHTRRHRDPHRRDNTNNGSTTSTTTRCP